MIYEVFLHDYFWLSFLPISFLGVGFWILFFERERKQKDPLVLFFLALDAGMLSAVAFASFGAEIGLENFWLKIIGEEFFKVTFAIVAMEMLKRRFNMVGAGVVYGFTIGLGFALAENLVYLTNAYEIAGFSSSFWLVFQGRFWTSTLLHGITTAIFGLFYAGAYLADTVHKKNHESPLKALFIPFRKDNFIQIITFHISRVHLLFTHKPTLNGHYARGVIFEGFLVAVIVHTIFNLSLDTAPLISLFVPGYDIEGSTHPEIAFMLALGGMMFLRNKVALVSKEK